MTHRLQFADWVAFPVPQVFAFFSNPENLPRLMPPETATKIDSFQLVAPPALPGQDAINAHHFAGKGSIIDTSFRPIAIPLLAAQMDGCHYGIRMEPILRRYADQKDHSNAGITGMNSLPEARIGIEGTLVRDVIDYEVGFGPLGAARELTFH